MKKLLIILFIFFPTDTKAIQKLTEQDIQDIYHTFVRPNMTEEYMYRYDPLPLEKNNIPWNWKGKDFPRVIALLEFERFIAENNITSKKALAMNGHDPEWYYIKSDKIVHIDYVADPINHDLHTLDLAEKDFDFVMINQTLEHLYDPIRCLENIYRHMKEGGILYFNVPGNNIPHSTPFHYYTGFTPTGVGALVRAAGFKILSIGHWGNSEYLLKLLKTNNWPDYTNVGRPGLNEANCCPVIVWIFAIKEY